MLHNGFDQLLGFKNLQRWAGDAEIGAAHVAFHGILAEECLGTQSHAGSG